MSKDDVRFFAIVKKGPLVSAPDSTYVRIDDCLMKYSFQMSLLQSSSLEEQYPSFGTTGLYGTWTLKENLLSLEAPATDFTLLVSENVEPFKSAYAKVLPLIIQGSQG